MNTAVAMKKRNAAIDLTKFILAVLVVMIHVRPFSGDVQFWVVDCLARFADPMFFVISSYFIFYKLETNRKAAAAGRWDGRMMWNYVKRILILYTIWFVLNLPNFKWQLTFTGWKMMPFRLFQAYCLSGPYDTALWFMPALLWGTILTYFIGRKGNVRVALLCGFILHIPSYFDGVYAVFVEDVAWFHRLVDAIESVFLWLGNGFTYGMFYCALGACVAVWNVNHREKLEAERKKYFRLFGMGTLIFFLLDVNESNMVRVFAWGGGYGTLLMMAPFSVCFLEFLLLSEMKGRPAYRFLQKMSIVIFGVHYLVMYRLRDWLADVEWYTGSTTVQFLCVMAVSCVIAATVVWLSEHTKLKFLKYMY